ncbi:MAG: 4-hydroxy-3-methylbut-2-enyl diphosphate reductase, partial [Erysipelotrichaceae bacterium]
VSPQIIKKAQQKNLIIVNATCKYVLQSQNYVQEYLDEGYQILYIGQKNHPEANGIIEIDPNNIILYETYDDLKKLDPHKKTVCTCQTTMNIKTIYNLIEYAKNKINNLVIIEEICQATRLRQEAILKLQNQNIDILFIVGDKKSNNANKLVEIGNSINIPTYLINDDKDIDTSLLKGCKKAAISSAASTPTNITDNVITYLETFNID